MKNTPVKLELVKPNSETMSESIDNSGNLNIKNSRTFEPLETFLYFRCGVLKLTYVEGTKEVSW